MARAPEFRRLPLPPLITLLCAMVLSSCGAVSSAQSPSPTAKSKPSTSQTTTSPGVSISPAVLTHLSMLTSSTGYGYFISSGLTTCQSIVARTKDGGSTFVHPAIVASYPCNQGNSPPSRLTFDQHGNGFLYDPGLATTHNGGRTWSTTSVANTVVDILVTPQMLWMLTASCAPGTTPTSGCPLALSSSSDGGRSWVRDTSLPTMVMSENATGGEADLISTSHGGLDLLLAPLPGVASSTATLWQGGNGGDTWASRTVPCGLSPSDVAMTTGPKGELVVSCAGEPGAGQQPKSIVVSHNGGTTWSTVFACPLSPPVPKSCSSSPLANGYLGGLAAPTSTRFFLVGGRSSLLVSSDGGKHWTPSPNVPANTSGGTTQIHFLNSDLGFVVGNDNALGGAMVIWRTVNGGISWKVVVPHLR